MVLGVLKDAQPTALSHEGLCPVEPCTGAWLDERLCLLQVYEAGKGLTQATQDPKVQHHSAHLIGVPCSVCSIVFSPRGEAHRLTYIACYLSSTQSRMLFQ